VPAKIDRTRFFYVGAACVLLGLALVGFSQFYLHGRAYGGQELTPPIRTWILLHGITMSAWMLLFLVQPLLVVSGNRRIHMRLGWLGAALAVAVVFFGYNLAVASARVTPPEFEIWGMTALPFLTLPLFSILLFGGFVAVGVLYRKRREVHRPMMLLAMVATLPAAIDRIDAIRGLYDQAAWGHVFGAYTGPLIVGLGFLLLYRLLAGRWDKYYAVGYGVLAVVSALIMLLAPTAAWQRIATYLTS
jgi:hypothetical protein